jgi:transcriptional regulator with XRE-family HTH domain
MSEISGTERIPSWTLGDRLDKALHDAGMGKQEMADFLEVSRNTVGAYCADRQRPSGAVLRAWALRTGVPLEWLKRGDGFGRITTSSLRAPLRRESRTA